MHRRHFILASAGLLLPIIARAASPTSEAIIAGAGQLTKPSEGTRHIQTGDQRAILRLGKNAFLVAPHSDIKFEMDEADMHIRLAHLMKGAVHSVFDPAQKSERNVITNFATIAIRGTAHYCEIEAAHNRTYSCCCYGHVHLQSAAGDATLTQKTHYHDARIITAAGTIEASPYDVPLNHYDNSLVRLEAVVGRAPRWKLPNGEMIFISPFDI